MTGPEHYREAEKLLALDEVIHKEGGDPGDILQAAQVHATLALAAATVGLSSRAGSTSKDDSEWRDAAVTPDDPADPLGSIW